ncbi:MAG: hypothetical protein LBD16_00765 [Oscillospiraceae bacterium]|nr:hypothetical protein [Oscillospiraceae bacterium]
MKTQSESRFARVISLVLCIAVLLSAGISQRAEADSPENDVNAINEAIELYLNTFGDGLHMSVYYPGSHYDVGRIYYDDTSFYRYRSDYGNLNLNCFISAYHFFMNTCGIDITETTPDSVFMKALLKKLQDATDVKERTIFYTLVYLIENKPGNSYKTDVALPTFAADASVARPLQRLWALSTVCNNE